MSFNVKTEAQVFCAARGISARGELGLIALLTRAIEATEIEAIDAAIQAERERCARVADNTDIPFKDDLTESGQRARFYQKHVKNAWIQCSRQIAKRIRSREEPSDDRQAE